MTGISSAWTAEIEVDAALARSLIGEQFGDLAGARVEPFGVGWDNTAYRVDGELVFRFPRRAIAVPGLEREIAVLPRLAPRLPLAIPEPTLVGTPSARYPWPFAGYRLLSGRTACTFDLLRELVAAWVEPLARFLSALHSIPEAEGLALGAEHDRLGKLDVMKWRDRAGARLEQARDAGWLEGGSWRDVLDATSAEGPPGRSVLCHGDLYARHLLVSEQRSLAGVIDWGDVHVGDPAVDLTIGWMLFSGEARERFWSLYGSATPRERELARFRAICHSIGTLLYAIEVSDGDLERACRSSLASALAT